MTDLSSILPGYEKLAETIIAMPLPESPPDITLSRPHQSDKSPAAPLPLPSTWRERRGAHRRMPILCAVNFYLQIAVIVIGATFLPTDFLENPCLVIWWLSLTLSAANVGIGGYLMGIITRRMDIVVEVTEEVENDRAFRQALNSLQPWLASGISLGVAVKLYGI